MAKVTLYDPEDLEYELPGVCMVCGHDATTYKARKFAWNPGWVYILLLAGLLPFIIVALLMTKRMTVDVPLCGRHRHHWLARQGLVLGSFFGLIALLFLVGALAPPRDVGVWIGLVMLFGFIGWLVLAIVVNLGMIRPTQITEDMITLQSVSDEFKTALKEWRREADERDQEREERDRREPPRRRRNEEDRGRYRDEFEEDRPRRPRDEYRAEEP